MKQSCFPRVLVVLLAVVVLVPAAFAKANSEYTQIGHDIRIAADQKTSDLTCINCSVYVRGQVAGGITTVHGNVVIEENGTVAGDVTAVLGDVRADRGTKIAGEVTAVGGAVHRHPEATIAGDVTALEGSIWFFLIVVAPILVLAGIIALIVWLVQRRRPSPTLARAA
jgi:Polymer-forming cytoskeletal